MISLSDAIEYANTYGVEFDTHESDHAIVQIEDKSGAVLDVLLYVDDGELCYRETYCDPGLRHYGCSGTVDNARALVSLLRIEDDD